MVNIQQAMQLMNQFQNPQQLIQKMGIPQEFANTPQDVANYLLQNGKVTQQQIDQATNMYQRFFKR